MSFNIDKLVVGVDRVFGSIYNLLGLINRLLWVGIYADNARINGTGPRRVAGLTVEASEFQRSKVKHPDVMRWAWPSRLHKALPFFLSHFSSFKGHECHFRYQQLLRNYAASEVDNPLLTTSRIQLSRLLQERVNREHSCRGYFCVPLSAAVDTFVERTSVLQGECRP